jgi:transposase
MPKVFIVKLSSSDLNRLQHISARSANWRERQRAETLILLDEGLSTKEVAERVGIHVRTVSYTRSDWHERGFESLIDRPRTGAPKKLSPKELEKIQEAAAQEPLTANALLAKHLDAGGTPVHVNTLKGALKRAEFVWKRTRHSLKKKK